MNTLSGSDRTGIQLFSVCALVLVTGVVGASLVEYAAPKIDSASLRAIGQPTSGCVSIVLDVTDPLPPGQQQSLDEQVRGLEVEDLRPNELVTVWRLGRGEDGPERLFARYYPGRRVNPIWGNPARVAARCDSLFWKPMLEQLHALPAGSADHSPILESVREIAEQPEFADPTKPRRLLIVSDLFENTDILSFYKNVPAFEGFESSPAFGRARANLGGVVVEVLYLARPGESAATADQLREFWRSYFSACGAGPVRFEKL